VYGSENTHKNRLCLERSGVLHQHADGRPKQVLLTK
jgi:hypothetical protein